MRFATSVTVGLIVVVFVEIAASHAQDDSANALLQRGLGKLQTGDLAGAEADLRSAVDLEPELARGWYLLGYALHNQQKWSEAIEAHQRATDFPSTRPIAIVNLAAALAKTGETERALLTIKLAVEEGFGNRTRLLSDPDFDGLRQDPAFQALIPSALSEDELFVEDANVLHLWHGETANDEFGWVARRVGDVDEDGVHDFVTTAPSFGGGAGKMYIYSSRTGSLLFEQAGNEGERLGNGAAGAGDVNADGTPDVIVGAPGAAGTTATGSAYVYSGKDGSVLHQLSGEQAGDRFGYKVCGVGDVNGDGHADVAVGAIAGDGEQTKSGCVYGFSGRDGELLFKIQGEATGDQFGSALAGLESTTSTRLVVGAQAAGEQDRGMAVVYDFEEGQPTVTFVIESEPTNVNLGQMFVSFLGDVDGDDVSDVYVSDFSASTNGPGTGSVYVHSGATGDRILALHGSQPGEGFGTSPSDAGDVDGDGRGDLIVGAWQNREGARSGGKVTLFSGASGKPIRTWTCRESGDTFGFDATGIGDVDGDGTIDFLLTSAWSSAKAPKAGRVLIVSGASQD